MYNEDVDVAVIICYKEDMMYKVSTLLYLSNLGRPVVEITQDNSQYTGMEEGSQFKGGGGVN